MPMERRTPNGNTISPTDLRREFEEKVQQIPVNGVGIEQVQIVNEYREIVLEAIQG